MKKFEEITLNRSDFPAVIDDDRLGVEYRLEGDRYIPHYKKGVKHRDHPKAFFHPDIRQIDPPFELLEAMTTRGTIGKFGRLYFDHLRRHNIPRYARLVAAATLPLDLEEADDKGMVRVLEVWHRLLEEENAEGLTENDGIAWIKFAGACARRAEEQVTRELLNEWNAEIN